MDVQAETLLCNSPLRLEREQPVVTRHEDNGWDQRPSFHREGIVKRTAGLVPNPSSRFSPQIGRHVVSVVGCDLLRASWA